MTEESRNSGIRPWSTEPTPDDRILIGSEKAKLSATYLNNMAVGLFTVGAAAPVVAIFTVENAKVHNALFSVAVCTSISILSHLYARWQLGVIRK